MRTPRDLAALAVGAVFLLIYTLTAARGLLFADSGELQTVAMLGGIPHSTGYPLWVALAHAFTWLPLGAPEFRVTLFSGVAGAAAVALLVRRLGDLGIGLAASVATAGALGVSFSFWRVSVRAEVYTLSVAMALLAFGAVLAARRSGTIRDALWAAFLLGLVLAVHLSFAPAVAIAGLALAWRAARGLPPAGGSAAVPRLASLLGAFALGLTPYLLLVALDAARVPANFLDLVRHARDLLGGGGPPLDSPWRGVWWLVTGRNVYPPQPIGLHPRSIAAGLGDAGAVLFLFELGPVALPLMVAGAIRRWRRDRVLAAGLVLAFAGSMKFAAILQSGAMLHLFQFPAILIGAILAADGVDALVSAAPRARIALAVLAWGALALPPLALRLYAESRPIGARGWQVREEDRTLRSGPLPGMAGSPDAARWARAALDSIPRDALVLAMWSDFTPLRHLRLTEGRRPDLALDQIAGETLALRIRRWQRGHDPERAALVFAARGPRESPYLDSADSIAMPDGRFLFVVRGALSDSLLDAEIAKAR